VQLLAVWEMMYWHHENVITRFPCLLERAGIFIGKFPGPGKFWNLLGNDADGECNDADADKRL